MPKSKAPINPLHSDKYPPNYFQWQFSPQYPRFSVPTMADWRQLEFRACNEALDRGWLSVKDLTPPGEKNIQQSKLLDLLHARPQASEITPMMSKRKALLTEEDIQRSVAEYSPETDSDDEKTEDGLQILAAVNFQELDDLAMSLADGPEALNNGFNMHTQRSNLLKRIQKQEDLLQDASNAMKIMTRNLLRNEDKIISKAVEENWSLRIKLKEKEAELGTAAQRIASLESQPRGEYHDQLAKARQQGEDEGWKRAMDDLHEVQVAQLKKVREDARQEGYRQGLASVKKAPLPKKNPVQHSAERVTIRSLQRQLKDLQASRSSELTRAREQGRRDGKQDQALTRALESYEVNSNRKVRCGVRHKMSFYTILKHRSVENSGQYIGIGVIYHKISFRPQCCQKVACLVIRYSSFWHG